MGRQRGLEKKDFNLAAPAAGTAITLLPSLTWGISERMPGGDVGVGFY
jgi:hypothetical protein